MATPCTENESELRAVASHLRMVRKLQERTQEDVAAASGLDKAALCRIERGKTVADAPTLRRIGEALGLGEGDLAMLSGKRQSLEAMAAGREGYAAFAAFADARLVPRMPAPDVAAMVNLTAALNRVADLLERLPTEPTGRTAKRAGAGRAGKKVLSRV